MIRFVMWVLHLYYKRYGEAIFYIKGTGKDYPRYLLYTEDSEVYRRMEES